MLGSSPLLHPFAEVGLENDDFSSLCANPNVCSESNRLEKLGELLASLFKTSSKDIEGLSIASITLEYLRSPVFSRSANLKGAFIGVYLGLHAHSSLQVTSFRNWQKKYRATRNLAALYSLCHMLSSVVICGSALWTHATTQRAFQNTT